jgi:single-stranded-DNA-specific exonuclease
VCIFHLPEVGPAFEPHPGETRKYEAENSMTDSNTVKSFRNRAWAQPEFDTASVEVLMEGGAPQAIAPILAARGMAAESVQAYLAPTIKDALPNPSFFLDMDKAADRIVSAIQADEKIVIWSDYDVDGATSAATLGRFLKDCGRPNFDIYIPDRIKEGYGPNAEGLLSLHADGADLVCILDSGTVAVEQLKAAHAAGLDVVVIDHHAAEDELPPAVAVVNPNRLDQEEGYGHVCAAGMTFIAVVAANMRLRKMGWFDGQDGRPENSVDLMSYLDLVALGTVCDVVPLVGLNRAFVARGLPYLSGRGLPGIQALAAVAACKDDIDPGACGFGLGPRINAGGRIGDSGAGADLLLETDPQKAEAKAEVLNDLNVERQSMERACTAEAIAQLEGQFIPGETRQLAVAIVDAHEGIVGISAARLKEAFDVPAFVLAPTPEGTLKGSGRSVSGFDLGAAIIAARKAGLIVKGGGHAMAGGLTIEHDKVEEFTAFVNARIATSDYAKTGVISKVDAELTLNQARVDFVDAMGDMAPFGMGNPTPRVVLKGVLLADVRILKEKHLKCVFHDPKHGSKGRKVEALIWNAVDTAFGTALQGAVGEQVDALGALEINEYRERRNVQMKLDDLRLSA